MTKDFYILGAIVGSTADRWTEEDLCPQQFKKFASTLERGDELVLHLNSVGGDVFAGFAIAQMIKELSDKGIPSVAIVEGLAASIASVIACACDTIKMSESSALMIHKAWTVMQGNADEMKKQAQTMDKIDAAIRSFYHKHFDLTDEQLEAYMADETWIFGAEAKNYKLNCEVTPAEKQYKIAASLNKMNYTKVPKALKDMIMDNEIKNEQIDSTTSDITNEIQEEVEKVEEQLEEKKVEEPKVEAPVVEDKIECLPMDEVEKRVSGMQSTMAKKMDAMKKEYDAKITEFENQLKMKDEELEQAKAEATSLNQKLEDASKELQATVSALEEKSNALATLNAGVLTPTETKESWRNLKGQKFLDYVNAHRKELSK